MRHRYPEVVLRAAGSTTGRFRHDDWPKKCRMVCCVLRRKPATKARTHESARVTVGSWAFGMVWRKLRSASFSRTSNDPYASVLNGTKLVSVYSRTTSTLQSARDALAANEGVSRMAGNGSIDEQQICLITSGGFAQMRHGALLGNEHGGRTAGMVGMQRRSETPDDLRLHPSRRQGQFFRPGGTQFRSERHQ